jgi:hypothetical protein
VHDLRQTFVSRLRAAGAASAWQTAPVEGVRQELLFVAKLVSSLAAFGELMELPFSAMSRPSRFDGQRLLRTSPAL